MGRIPLPFRGYSLQRVYVGEVVAFTAFGISWLAASWDLVGRLGRRATSTTQPRPRTLPSTSRRRRRDRLPLLGGELFENDLPAVPAVRERQVSHARHGHVAHVLRTGSRAHFAGTTQS